MLFFAMQRDHVVLAESDLARLLDLLADVLDTAEDSAVWHGARVVCVVHGPDRRVTWLDPSHKPATAA